MCVREGGGWGVLCSGGPNIMASRALRPKDALFGRGLWSLAEADAITGYIQKIYRAI